MKVFLNIIPVFVIISLIILISAGCTRSLDNTPALEENMFEKEENLSEEDNDIENFSTENILIDGNINEDEYFFSLKDDATGVELFWSNNNMDLYVGIKSLSFGWTAIGFNPKSAMREANIIFLAVDDSKVLIRDDFGTSPFTHDDDKKLGGSFDVKEYIGIKTDENIIFEFMISLDSGDDFDTLLVPGDSYNIILAVNENNMDFDRKHTTKSSIRIQLN